MPRTNLIRTNLHPYHIYIRCNNREWFDVPIGTVWDILLESLTLAYEKYPVHLQAFVLMANHYHGLVWTPNSDLDKFMYVLNSEISKRLRKRTGRINRIFGDRYKWSLIKDEKYHQNVLRYIYQNPLKVDVVKKCEDYTYSTLHYIIQKKDFPIPLWNHSSKEDLEFINDSTFERENLTPSLLKPIFKPKKSRTSRRQIS